MANKHCREPIGHTCPNIDKIIDSINRIGKFISLKGNEDEEELKEVIDNVRAEVWGMDDILEKLRNSNDLLRSWGIEEAYKVDELEEEIASLYAKHDL